MFERRLKTVLALAIACSAVLAWRLYQLQIVHGADFSEKVEAALLVPRQYLPPLRGRINDRFGHVLVSDEPAHDVTVHYGTLSMNETYLLRVADYLRQKEPRWAKATRHELRAEVQERIAAMWLALERISGTPLPQLRQRRDAVCQSIETLRRHLWTVRKESGYDEPFDKVHLKEEEAFHPILRNIPPQVRTRIELEMSRSPFVRIEPSVRRVWNTEARSLCHVLGRLGQVSSDDIENDPLRGDALAGYRPSDLVGVSGIERLAEPMLRGKRGYEDRHRDGHVEDRAPPIDGPDVQLTLDVELQERVAQILEDAVAQHPASTGASGVVIDVRTREILALVSVPTYDPSALADNYAALRDDSKYTPLRFRAVGDEYQPGSILKPAALLAGFYNDLLDPLHRVHCDGHFIPGSQKWHCWTHWRGMPGHGDLNAEEAIQHSCNVFFYSLGQKIGARRLTDFYRRIVDGCPGAPGDEGIRTSTGLIEERTGIIPTREWMKNHRRREFNPADGRNYAIGQGEIQITPLQAANFFATLAEGEYQAPTLIANDGRDRPLVAFPNIPKSAWQMIRRGLYRCVNEDGGTAYQYARLDNLAICGKTGSAQCVSRVTHWRYWFVEGGKKVSVVAPTIEAARERLNLDRDAKCMRREIVSRWPPRDPEKSDVPTHAWFAGFAPYENPQIALAIIIEHGGGGGSAAGPAAQAIFQALLDSPRGYLSASGMAIASPINDRDDLQGGSEP
ncbi:MAG TPA: penicillin-binding transpeptidase domain-containing protein [Phycisphaerae bacterium]|nr:penicillin-binding transpeptidase domain-containing protein [Phycisphaerae bacterium]